MTSLTATPTLPDPDTAQGQDALIAHAVDLMDVILDGADVDTIGVKNWWPRATSALIAAAARAESVRDVVAEAARKLQVETLPERAAGVIRDVEAATAAPATFEWWRRACERDAVYIVAFLRDKRTARKPKTTKASQPLPQPTLDDQEPMF